MIKVKITGAKVIANKFSRASQRLDDTKKIIDQEVDLIMSRSRNKAPEDTGALKASQFKIPLKNDGYGYRVGFRKFYAPFQEFGTLRSYKATGEYAEFDKFASTFRVSQDKSGKGNRPRRYFLHFYIIARKSILRKTGTVVKNIFK